jgi:uncharacterized protein YfaS (alpha-2-macroglobulin family)
MRTPLIAAAFLVSGAIRLAAQDTLQILRHTPNDTASPGNIITVTFDRPLFGNLDQAMSAASVFSISPSIPGKVDWRDPITLRFIPDQPFVPGQQISVRISDTVRAIDGSRLPAPYQFSFRVPGPRLLSRSFDGQRTLPPNAKIELTYSAPIDPARLERNANIAYTCDDLSNGAMPLYITGQRRVAPGGYYPMYNLWGAPGDTSATRFFRVVELAPTTTPPLGCALRISLPTTVDDSAFGRVEVYKQRSANHFTLAALECEETVWCSLGALNLTITSPISHEEANKRISVVGVPRVQVAMTSGPPDTWQIAFAQKPRATYIVRVDTAIRDIYGRTLEGTNERRISVGDHKPVLVHPSGVMTVLPSSTRTMPIRTMNVSTLRMITTPVRDANRQAVLANIAYDLSSGAVTAEAETTLVTVPSRLNSDMKVEVPLPPNVFRPNGHLVRARFEIAKIDSTAQPHGEHAAQTVEIINGGFGTVLQASDLAMTMKIGLAEAVVHVTSASDARPRGGVVVTDIDPSGRVVAQTTTDANGMARLSASLKPAALRGSLDSADPFPPRGHLVEATLGTDRLMMPFGFRAIGYTDRNPTATEDLGGRREVLPPATVAIFTDRAIYRLGERVFIKAIARSGAAGELRVPASGDSIRLILRQPDRWPDAPRPIRDSIVTLSAFGTYSDSIVLPKTLPLGEYTAEVEYAVRTGRVSARAGFTLAEYRAPEFSAEVKADSQYSNKDSEAFIVSGDYFLGAPMRGAATKWELTSAPTPYWEPTFPNADDWWFGDGTSAPSPRRAGQGSVVLDENGRANVRIAIGNVPRTQPTEFTLTAFVSDANRQQITASNSVTVLRARRHIGMRPDSGMHSLAVGQSFNVQLKVVDDSGTLIPNVRAVATTTRRRWVRSNGKMQRADTVIARQVLVSRDRPIAYSFRTDSAGPYDFRIAPLEATDEISATSIPANVVVPVRVVATGSPYLLRLTPDRQEFAIGDTARIRFVSPFDSASAWVTTEREGIMSSRIISVRRGNNTLDIPIEANHVPNLWVGVSMIARRPDGARLDSASDRMRAGYVELRVDASPKRLTVAVSPDKREYVPGSTASIALDVRDASGRGARSEVALWAVDEGVLSMMSYSIPDLFSAFYRARGLTYELRSTIPAIMTNNAAARLSLQAAVLRLSEVVMTAATVGNSVARIKSPTVRHDFRSTAFFLGNVVTDATGRATARPRLPDNLTSFRVIAVAVDSLSRFGTGTDSIVVTLPLTARASLPRFVRPSDSVFAGAVINSRDTLSRRIDVATTAAGVSIFGPSRRTVDFKRGAGIEARFDYVVPPRNAAGDTVKIQLSATDGKDEDASETALPVKPDFTPRAHTIIGSARGSADVVFSLPAGIDPEKSRVSLRIGTTPLAPMLAAFDRLRVYPYYCTEQISSLGRAMIAIWNATRHTPHPAFKAPPIPALQQLVDEISSRQRPDGAIRYWRDFPWSTAWLTAHAGLFLLDARDAGASVDTVVIHRLGEYMSRVAGAPLPPVGENRIEQRWHRLDLGYHVAAVDVLRRIGIANRAAEDSLLAINTRMTWEDRLRLAEVVSTRGDRQSDARAIVDDAWKTIVVAGNRVDLPDTANPARDFPSRIAPAARLLTATFALEPDRPLIGGLIETVLQQSRAEGAWTWSTQDYSSAVLALAAFTDTSSTTHRARLVGRSGVLADAGDSTVKVPLTGLLETDANGRPRLSLKVESEKSDRVFYAVQVDEVPLEAPTRPDIKGMVVERWYERYADGTPITSIQEGDLVRVRLRVTVPANRQFVALEDPLPAGLEAVDFSLRTSARIESTDAAPTDRGASSPLQAWLYGSWMEGGWSAWDHRELRDDRVVYFARVLWPGTYEASYIARATTSGNFVRPPAHAEEMYNPALQGRSDGGRFQVIRQRRP